ncbi:MAG: HAD hydrolase-like protein, partial [Oscillospiraceae bacterium]
YQAMERQGVTPAQTALIGDQIFTDVLCGNRGGVATILVEPLRLAGNPGRYLRYAAEWPFRAMAKRQNRTSR